MKHAVLGAGGVGGLVAAVLARRGAEVTAIVRDAGHPRSIAVDSAVLGSFEADVMPVTRLERDVDVVWVTVKATQLEAALPAVPAGCVKGTVIPLLNGIDHMAALRAVYPSVTAGALYGEAERVAPGRIVQPSAFLRVQLAGPLAEEACADLTAGGLSCTVRDDELAVLWQKLVILAPFALATTADQAPLGDIRADPARWRRLHAAIDEVAAVAHALNVRVDGDAAKQGLAGAGDDFRSSMQKDRAAGRRLELDHLVEPIVREGRAHGVPTPVIEALAEQIRTAA
jgi:2-dehydropantoate 2-reductase